MSAININIRVQYFKGIILTKLSYNFYAQWQRKRTSSKIFTSHFYAFSELFLIYNRLCYFIWNINQQ